MTPALLGNLGVSLALAFSLLGLGLALLAYLQGDGRFLRGARALVFPAFLAALAAFLALEWALLVHDFSLAYVARNHSTKDPLWVTLVTPWAALEGSILLWGLLQTLYTLLASRKPLDPWRASLVLAVLFGIQVFFFGVMATIASPFETLPDPPPDGVGPNPLLQNHWMMAVHPVLMYLGFVGLSVPYAYAVAAMATRRYQTWVEETRWWTLIAWGFLTAGKVAGMWWSYEVLGWGGYWAWDPVENASFIPWLLATAFLHTAFVQQTRGAFKTWNFAFVTLAFAATLLGTFLTRSGIIQSVHAFAEGPVGPAFLGFFLFATGLGLGLLSRVSREVRDAALFHPLSREGALLLGAFFFAGWALVVVLGTFYPLLVEAFTGAKVSVGAPFFNQVSAPLGAGILLLMGVGPLLPWRRARGEVLRNLLGLLRLGALPLQRRRHLPPGPGGGFGPGAGGAFPLGLLGEPQAGGKPRGPLRRGPHGACHRLQPDLPPGEREDPLPGRGLGGGGRAHDLPGGAGLGRGAALRRGGPSKDRPLRGGQAQAPLLPPDE